ncbi:Retrovirus-related Pol polyprotein from transposon TNT 1-94 [Senna tora]|uniref:Retrovirus-related Pol polyprotein from transposon TNT 1-94 n=1 Tax=Senna tora TaxID=362788 RepID=A0A835CAC4_9FABA|nr:Retrovirus-related Pol polyprotein from transposon TNT 1-94 [Senna tora]
MSLIGCEALSSFSFPNYWELLDVKPLLLHPRLPPRYGLQSNPLIGKHPNIFKNDEDKKNGKITNEYEHWQKQDQLLASWLIASMAEEMVTRMVGESNSQQIWECLAEFFSGKTQAKERFLKTQLRSLKKGTKAMSEFLLFVKNLVDELISVRSPISDHEHTESIFDGLRREYESFITNVSLRKDDYSVVEVEALLLTQETWVEKFKENNESISANLGQAQGANKNQGQSNRPPNPNFNNNKRGYNSFNRGGFRGGFNNSNCFNRGRGRGRNNNAYPWSNTRP